ncbi:MAG: hypothetical protein A2293_08025 [Elusimicrobia bacterium RIFOXYB2_FULL_49_7]|nr:MAG: hypothetical protein A2293_08025 [Elusimicrobia bacterium RIFOXYB2_FULL_49_7]
MAEQPMTREEIVEDIKNNLEVLTPKAVSDYTVQLSILLGELGTDLALAEIEYAKKWDALRIHCDTDGQAEKKSKATEEYYKRRMLEFRFKSTKELIQSLKKRLTVLSDEAHNNY